MISISGRERTRNAPKSRVIGEAGANEDETAPVRPSGVSGPEMDPDLLDPQKQIDEIEYRYDFECEFLLPPDAETSRSIPT